MVLALLKAVAVGSPCHDRHFLSGFLQETRQALSENKGHSIKLAFPKIAAVITLC